MSANRQGPAGEASIAVRSLGLGLPPGYRTGQHQHPWPQLVHASSGALEVRARGCVWILPARRALWIPALQEHEVTAFGRVRMRTLYLRPDLAGSLPETPAVLGVSGLLRELVHTTCARGMLRDDVPGELRLTGVLVDELLVAPLMHLELPEPRDERARGVARRVLRTPGEQATLAQLADGSGGSPRTIERLFHAETQMSFGRWRQQARLMHAVRLLCDGASVTEAGLEVGYSSTSAFVAMFRGSLGVTPGAFRQSDRD